MSTEHRVRVDGGKYTFVVHAEKCEISVLRADLPWQSMPALASPIQSMMRELDAARIVLQAVRAYASAPAHRVPASITAALRLHDALVGDQELPSAWCDSDEYSRILGASPEGGG